MRQDGHPPLSDQWREMWRLLLPPGVFGGLEGEDSHLGIPHAVPQEPPQSTNLIGPPGSHLCHLTRQVPFRLLPRLSLALTGVELQMTCIIVHPRYDNKYH